MRVSRKSGKVRLEHKPEGRDFYFGSLSKQPGAAEGSGLLPPMSPLLDLGVCVCVGGGWSAKGTRIAGAGKTDLSLWPLVAETLGGIFKACRAFPPRLQRPWIMILNLQGCCEVTGRWHLSHAWHFAGSNSQTGTGGPSLRPIPEELLRCESYLALRCSRVNRCCLQLERLSAWAGEGASSSTRGSETHNHLVTYRSSQQR